MKTVRQRILDFIRSQRIVTAGDLSKTFRMSEQNARYHLSKLVEQGLVQKVDNRIQQGKGRPAMAYSPSRKILGNNLDLLSSAMLQFLLDKSNSKTGEQVIQELAALVMEKMLIDTENQSKFSQFGIPLTRRLNQLTKILNEYHYHSRWEAHKDSPRLILGHCPFSEIISEHPEICRLDARLIENLLENHVEQIAKLSKDPSGLMFCMFRLTREKV